jgi:hypothetical protein
VVWSIAEQARADERAAQAADDHHPAHLEVDAPAPHVDHHAGDAGAGDLCRRRCDRDRRRDSIEMSMRSGEETPADAEHSGEKAYQKPSTTMNSALTDWLRSEVNVHACGKD